MARCAGCKYFVRDENLNAFRRLSSPRQDRGFCHVAPPVAIQGGEGMSANPSVSFQHPVVDATFQCSQYERAGVVIPLAPAPTRKVVKKSTYRRV